MFPPLPCAGARWGPGTHPALVPAPTTGRGCLAVASVSSPVPAASPWVAHSPWLQLGCAYIGPYFAGGVGWGRRRAPSHRRDEPWKTGCWLNTAGDTRERRNAGGVACDT